MPRDIVEINTTFDEYATRLAHDAAGTAIANLIEEMEKADNGKTKTHYKSAVKLARERLTRYGTECSNNGYDVVRIPEKDVLRKPSCESSPTLTSEGFDWKAFYLEFLAFFGAGAAVFAMFFFFAGLWAA